MAAHLAKRNVEKIIPGVMMLKLIAKSSDLTLVDIRIREDNKLKRANVKAGSLKTMMCFDNDL